MAGSLEPRGGEPPERAPSAELEPRRPAQLELPGTSAEPYLGRFRFALGALGGFGLAAVIVAVVVFAGGRPPQPPAWSAWKPSGSADQQIQQIAQHVGPTYRLPGGNQLVAVNAAPLATQGAPSITVRTSRALGQIDASSGVIYQLCGLGPKCSIDKGTPSAERGLLLRREGLELALYTLHYVKPVDMVIVTLPPAPGHNPSLAMFFRRQDVRRSLAHPLAETLAGAPPSLASLKRPAIAKDLLRKTTPEVYAVRFDPTSSQLVLDQSPPPAKPRRRH